MVDFFISRAGEDRELAIRIDEILRKYGFTTFIQDRDFGYSDFAEKMDEGFRLIDAGTRVIALHSSYYASKPHCMKEARYPLVTDPGNAHQKLIVLKVDDCKPSGFLKSIRYVDLSSCIDDQVALEEAILDIARRCKALPSSSHQAVARTQLSPKLDKLLLLLEAEDAEKQEQGFKVLVAMILGLAGVVIAFDFLLVAWNAVFETSYYAIFDTGFVMMISALSLFGVAYGYHHRIKTVAGQIVSHKPSIDDLRCLRRLVNERTWESKSMIQEAVRKAIKLMVEN